MSLHQRRRKYFKTLNCRSTMNSGWKFKKLIRRFWKTAFWSKDSTKVVFGHFSNLPFFQPMQNFLYEAMMLSNIGDGYHSLIWVSVELSCLSLGHNMYVACFEGVDEKASSQNVMTPKICIKRFQWNYKR